MKRFQVVMPNGDILAIAADRIKDVDGSLQFFIGADPVGEVTRWIGWCQVAELQVTPVAQQEIIQ